MKKSFLLILVLTFLSPVWSCELPKGEVIKIGCSYDCDFFYRMRLSMTAWGMGYSVKTVNLENLTPVENALTEVDGVLLPGGADIHPKYYWDEVDTDLKEYTKKNLHLAVLTSEGERRDPFEYSLVKHYLENDNLKRLPLLGICRGFQMMSVAQGIPLYLDIKAEVGIKNRRNRFDKIYLTPSDSLMSSIYKKKDGFRAYKIHHQGIRVPYYLKNKDRYPGVKVTSYSNKNHIAESLEYLGRPALGVQYHPERSFSGTGLPIFRWFLTKACEYKKEQK